MGRASSALTREKWADAALKAMARGGPTAVAVEPLARVMGVTKGSFYHHFASREALLEAALERWERRGTEGLLERLSSLSPVERLEALFGQASKGAVEETWAVLAQLAVHRDDPLIGPVLERVTQRRLAFLTHTWASAGFDQPEAERRALLAYAAYLGMVQLAVSAPESVPRGEALRAFVRRVLELLVPDSPD